MTNHVAEFHSISKVFSREFIRKNRTVAVCDVSLAIEEGETFFLIGPNGAGKTTLIRLLLNFTRPTSGTAKLFGQPNHLPSLRDMVGYFPERVKYPPYLTVKQFLMYWGQFSGLDGKLLLSRVGELLKFVRLETKKEASIKSLSKGMAVRVGLAQALLNDPKLLILDEPTDGLDPLGRIEFRDLLKELKTEGKTIFINSHLLSEVEQISTRVGIMDEGKLIKVDTVENLISEQYEMTIRFQCSSLDVITQLGIHYEVRQNGLGWNLLLTHSQDLDGAIKKLTNLGTTIQSVDKNQNSLENRFLSLVKKQS